MDLIDLFCRLLTSSELFNLIEEKLESKSISNKIESLCRKLIMDLIILNDSSTLRNFETKLATNLNKEYFIFYVEERLKRNKEISRCEDLLIKLISSNSINVKLINKFLKSSQKDSIYLAKKLIDYDIHSLYNYVIRLSYAEHYSTLELITPTIISYQNKKENYYLLIVLDLLIIPNIAIDDLLPNLDIQFAFEKLIFSYNNYHHHVYKRYGEFLYQQSKERFFKFEDLILSQKRNSIIINFAIDLPFCSKRKILNHLINTRKSDRDNQDVLIFIKHFPQYQNLIPML
jgi:hypothetical protein